MKEYLEKYGSRIVLMGLFVFLIHGAKLHSGIIGIDTEDIIHIQEKFYGGWLNTGRQGLYALKWLMNSLNFQPYMAGLFTLIIFTMAVSAFFLLWDKVLGQDVKSGFLSWLAGGLFLITHPILVEQFYFTLQSVEICIGLFFTVVSLYFIVGYTQEGKFWRLVISFLLLLLNFSIYQAMVVVFIFGAVSVLFLQGIRSLQCSEEISAKVLLKRILPFAGVFFISFIVNSLITKLFFSVSDYLGGQVLWGKFDIMDNFRAIAGHVIRVITGSKIPHYHFSFGLLCLLCVFMVVIVCGRFLTRGKSKGVVSVVLFYMAALLSTPFLMTLVCGGAPVLRSQFVLPFITGLLAYLAVALSTTEGFVGKKLCTIVITCVCIVGIWGQTATTMSLYYTDEMRYEQDAFLGRELITRIEQVRGEQELPVAIVGRKTFSGNNACIIGEMIGKSFFDHDTEVEPMYYWSTRRILGFLHTLGAEYPQADKSRFGEIANYSVSMPVWPMEGSVQIYDGMVVVKLSDIE